MSWWKYVGGLSPGPAAIPNLTPVAWQRVSYERGQPIEVITWLWGCQNSAWSVSCSAAPGAPVGHDGRPCRCACSI